MTISLISPFYFFTTFFFLWSYSRSIVIKETSGSGKTIWTPSSGSSFTTSFGSCSLLIFADSFFAWSRCLFTSFGSSIYRNCFLGFWSSFTESSIYLVNYYDFTSWFELFKSGTFCIDWSLFSLSFDFSDNFSSFFLSDFLFKASFSKTSLCDGGLNPFEMLLPVRSSLSFWALRSDFFDFGDLSFEAS